MKIEQALERFEMRCNIPDFQEEYEAVIKHIADQQAEIDCGDRNSCDAFDLIQEIGLRSEKMEKAIRYATDYLDDNELNTLGHRSKAHLELLGALPDGN